MAKMLADLGVLDFGRFQVGVFEVDGVPWFCSLAAGNGYLRQIEPAPKDKSLWTWRVFQETCYGG